MRQLKFLLSFFWITLFACIGWSQGELRPLGKEVVLQLPELQLKIKRQKYYDVEMSQALRKNWIDDQGGQRYFTDAEVTELIEQDKNKYLEREGAIDRSFVATVKEAAKSDPKHLFKVAVWAKFDPTVIPSGPGVEQLTGLNEDQHEALYQTYQISLNEVIQQVTAPLAGKMKELLGRDVQVSKLAPLINAEMTAEEILTLGRELDLVRIIFPHATKIQDEMLTATCSTGATTVQNLGVDADEVEVAVVEKNQVDNPMDCLDVIAVLGDGDISNHSTGVGGIIGSKLSMAPGVAPGANIISCDIDKNVDEDNNIEDGLAFGQDHGADVYNLSFGTDDDGEMHGEDILLDWVVRNARRTITKSAGNIGTAQNPGTCDNTKEVTSPGLGFNVITVGSYSDNESCDNSDDGISASSCYLDPESPHGDREKPEVSAPGVNITTLSTTDTTTCALQTSGGTSFAAPQVAGANALLIARNDAIRSWPEISKAILMATAFNDVDPGSTDHDGVGGINVAAADQTLQGIDGNWFGQAMAPGDFSSMDTYIVFQSVYVKPLTQRMKIAIAWDSNPDANGGYTVYNDFDLFVYRYGKLVADSSSFDNSFESVDIANPQEGYYDIVITVWGPLVDPDKGLPVAEYLGAAYAVIEHPCADNGSDVDGDTICGFVDNCPMDPNKDQNDADGDGAGEVCDNCKGSSNPDQADNDDDKFGDVCDDDDDNDGCDDNIDNNPLSSLQKIGMWFAPNCNPDSGDEYGFAGTASDNDGSLDCFILEWDKDGDGVSNADDPCPTIPGTDPLLCTYFKGACPEVTYNFCMFMPCEDFLIKIVSVVNPDPTSEIILERFDIVGEYLYIYPNAGQTLTDVAALLSNKVEGSEPHSDVWRIEIWQRPTEKEEARFVTAFTDYDPGLVESGALDQGFLLRLTSDHRNLNLILEPVSAVGAEPIGK
jgi:hypothetical protein